MSRLSLLSLLITALYTPVELRSQIPDAPAHVDPDERFKADLLLVVAHPDDETAIGSYLAKLVVDDGKRVAIVYCNRGSGGGNSTGEEQSNALGLVREVEARRALAAFRIFNVWFLDGRDTPGQDLFRSLNAWHHGAILEQVIRVIRLSRPDVIVTWLPHYVAGENHGDHQAAGVIATEAFDLAGDPTNFPVQLAAPRERTDIDNVGEGLDPWQPKKLYYFSDASHPIEAVGPAFDIQQISPSRKVPYYKLAAELHTYHSTQGEVALVASEAARTGNFDEFRKLVANYRLIFGKSVVPCSPRGGVFEGIREGPVSYVRPAGYKRERRTGVFLELGGVFAYYRQFWRGHGIEHIGLLVKPEVEVAVGSYVHIPLLIQNDTADSVAVVVRSELPEGWAEASGTARYRLGPYDVYAAQTFVIAPDELRDVMEPITWKAEHNGAVIGAATMNVRRREWTLPQ